MVTRQADGDPLAHISGINRPITFMDGFGLDPLETTSRFGTRPNPDTITDPSPAGALSRTMMERAKRIYDASVQYLADVDLIANDPKLSGEGRTDKIRALAEKVATAELDASLNRLIGNAGDARNGLTVDLSSAAPARPLGAAQTREEKNAAAFLESAATVREGQIVQSIIARFGKDESAAGLGGDKLAEYIAQTVATDPNLDAEVLRAVARAPRSVWVFNEEQHALLGRRLLELTDVNALYQRDGLDFAGDRLLAQRHDMARMLNRDLAPTIDPAIGGPTSMVPTASGRAAEEAQKLADLESSLSKQLGPMKRTVAPAGATLKKGVADEMAATASTV